MKTTRLLFLLFFGAGLLAPREGICQSIQTAKGSEADGIYAEIQVNYSTNKCRAPEITVSAVDSKADSLFGKGRLGKDWIKSFHYDISHRTWPYFQATNSFCGPVELKDAAGRKIPLVSKTFSSPEAYPETFSLKEEWYRHFFSNDPLGARRGSMIFPLPLVSSSSKLAEFQLKDYFDVKQPGQYQLTVWPKIYDRVATNNDICERIDLPPVSANVTLGNISDR